MNKSLLIFIALLNFSFLLKAQNLVVNPGFEEYKSQSKHGVLRLHTFTNWNQHYKEIEGLRTQYFLFYENKKKPKCWTKFNVPKPYSGNGMAGIRPNFWNVGDFKLGEKLQGQLIKALETDKLYCVTFRFYFSETAWFPAKELGVYFYNKGNLPTEKYDDNANIKVTPHISIGDSSITIPNEWHCFSQIYKAERGEKYFLLGSFQQLIFKSKYEAPRLNRKMKDGPYVGQKFRCHNDAMYFIDDVSVVPISDNSQCNCE